MARIRALKPEMASHETIAKVSRDARLLFVWLIGDADDEGRFVATPKRLAGTLYPYDDDVEPSNVLIWLTELVRVGLVGLYESAGGKFGVIRSWHQHQKPSHPAPSRLPAPPTCANENLGNPSGESPEEDEMTGGEAPPSSSTSSTGSSTDSGSSLASATPKPIDLALAASAHRWPDESDAHGGFSGEIVKAAKRNGQDAGRLTRIAAHVMRLQGLTKLGALSHPARSALMSRIGALGALIVDPDDLDRRWKAAANAPGWPSDIGPRMQRVIDTWETGPDRKRVGSSAASRQGDIYDDIEADLARMNGRQQIGVGR